MATDTRLGLKIAQGNRMHVMSFFCYFGSILYLLFASVTSLLCQPHAEAYVGVTNSDHNSSDALGVCVCVHLAILIAPQTQRGRRSPIVTS